MTVTLAESTPSALAGVDWPVVLAQLAHDHPGHRQTAAWCAEHRGPLLASAHARLAALAVHAGENGLHAYVGPGVACWLYWTARTALRTLALPGANPRVPAFRGPLHVDPRLPALPLLGLAAEHADRAGQRLIVRAVQLGPITDGRHTRHGSHSLVEISPATVDPAGVWRHEWSHHLDPVQRGPEASERYADTLGAMLAAHRPVDLGELDKLIARADQQIEDVSPVESTTAGSEAAPANADTGLPAPGQESILAFAALPLDPKKEIIEMTDQQQTDTSAYDERMTLKDQMHQATTYEQRADLQEQMLSVNADNSQGD